MRKHSLVTAAAVTIGVLGLAGAAQAQTTGPHAAVNVKLTASPSTVPAGLNTGVSVTNPCPTGVKPSSVTGLPAPDGTTTDVQASLAANKPVILAGVWPPPGPTSYAITASCPGGQTGTSTVTVEAAPKPADVTAVGADAIQSVVDQFSSDYNAKHSTGDLYSWDATNPITGAIGDNIKTKTGCTAVPRPDGSGAGISALTTENGTTGGHPCIDFARSSSARSASTPTSVTFATLAGDAVTYATQPSSNAPANLTTAQLNQIYSCAVTNWSQVGGKSAPIHAFIPQNGSGTRSFFLSAIGLTSPGSCVSDASGTLLESEGVNPVLNASKPDVIVPYSVGKYLAERYHSATCLNSACTANASGLICTPKGAQNLFGCNTHGTMVLNQINGTAPTTPFPLTSTTTKAVINAGFTPSFQRFLYEVVNSPEFSLPAYLKPYFSPTGWVCTNATAKKDLQNYGFLVLPAGTAAGDCGALS